MSCARSAGLCETRRASAAVRASNRVTTLPPPPPAQRCVDLLADEGKSIADALPRLDGARAKLFLCKIDAAYSSAQNGTPAAELAEFGIAELKSMEGRFHEWFGPCDPRHISSAIRMYRAFAELNVNFDNRRLLAEGMDAPPRFADYIDACVHTGQDMPVAEQMLYEFRLRALAVRARNGSPIRSKLGTLGC